MSDLRDLLHRGAAAPRHDVDPAAIGTAGRRRRRRRHMTTGALSGAVVAVVAFLGVSQLQQPDLFFGPEDESVLELPPRGEVGPDWLADGTPVFVVHHDDEQISVVEAVSTHDPFGLSKVVGWCGSSRTFDDPWHASQWDAHGSYINGPGPTGLATYAVRRDGDTVRVGDRNVSAGRTPDAGKPTPTWSGPSCDWPDTGTRLVDGSRRFPELKDAPLPVRRPEDLGGDGRVIVEGTIVYRSDGPARMCTTAKGEPPACPSGGPQVVDSEPVSGSFAVTGRFIARVEDSALREVIRFPDMTADSISRS